MIKILNYFFSFVKIISYLAAFGLTLFIIINMNNRLGKPITDSLLTFLPFLLLLVAISINILFGQRRVTHNIFYNICCSIVFLVIVFVAYRAIADEYMVVRYVFAQEINFNFFADFINPMLVMLYGLIFANILLMFTKKIEETKTS